MSSGPPHPHYTVLSDPSRLATTAAQRVAAAVAKAVRERGRCRMALAGGRTPGLLFRALRSGPFQELLDWSAVEIFWVDERCVPPDHPDSNYALAERELLRYVRVRRTHRIKGELRDPKLAAADYAAVLQAAFADVPLGARRLDLVLLGMGADGHVASLFPGHDLDIWAHADVVPVEQPPAALHHRVTLTPRLLNDCAQCLFVVAGSAKRAAIRSLLADPTPRASLPATLIRPMCGTVEWLLDRAAFPPSAPPKHD